MIKKRERKLALWVSAFPEQHAHLRPASASCSAPAGKGGSKSKGGASSTRAGGTQSGSSSTSFSGSKSKASFRRTLKPISAKLASARSAYAKRVKTWLLEPTNRWCLVMKKLRQPVSRATQCHHKHGRQGALLMDERYWLPVSAEGHRWIDANRRQAQELDLLGRGPWNTAPRVEQ